MMAQAGWPDTLLATTGHRPWPVPSTRHALTMSWTELLFAHWPIPAHEIAELLPAGLAVDTYEGAAWIGVVPFRMERVQLRGLPKVPGTRRFAEANLRTYVRHLASGHHGVYFFSLDASNPLAVLAARAWFHLPYYLARMHLRSDGDWLNYRSERVFSARPAVLDVRYRAISNGYALTPSQPGSLEYFLTERYALFTGSSRHLIRSDVHHLPWPLEPAEAEFRRLTLPAAHNVQVPAVVPIVHYSRKLDVVAWPPVVVR